MSDAFRFLMVITLTAAVACGGNSSESPAAVAGKPAAARPSNWSEINDEATRLFREGKRAESTAMYQKVVDSFPDFADARYGLAVNHEYIADGLADDAAQAAARTEHLRQAATHYTRFRDLSADDPMARADASRVLVKVYGPRGLKQMDKAVQAGRDYVKDEPEAAGSHATLAGVLRAQGDYDGATDVLQKALTVVPKKTAQLAGYLAEHVKESPGLQPSVVQQFLKAASDIADRLTADADPGNQADGFSVRSDIAEAQAQVEKDPAKKKQLLAEADRHRKQADQALKK